jgi:hypothetical protein
MASDEDSGAEREDPERLVPRLLRLHLKGSDTLMRLRPPRDEQRTGVAPNSIKIRTG